MAGLVSAVVALGLSGGLFFPVSSEGSRAGLGHRPAGWAAGRSWPSPGPVKSKADCWRRLCLSR